MIDINTASADEINAVPQLKGHVHQDKTEQHERFVERCRLGKNLACH